MKKNDIKNTLKEIKPDPYLETRLEAKVKESEPIPERGRKLALSTFVLCALIIASGLFAGTKLIKTETPTVQKTSATIETHQAQINTENVKETVSFIDFFTFNFEFYSNSRLCV